MKEILKGLVVSTQYPDNKLAEGLNVAVYIPDEDRYLEISKLAYLDGSQWRTDKGTYIFPEWEMRYISINPSKHEVYMVKDTQWLACIANDLDTEVNYTLLDNNFKSGIFMMECRECTSHFMAAKSQGLCEACSNKFRIAKIIVGKDKVKKKNLIFTTEKKLTVSQVRTIANVAFDAGRFSKQEFNDWYNKQDI